MKKNNQKIYHYKLYTINGFLCLYDLKLKRRVCLAYGIRPIYHFILNNRINPNFIKLNINYKDLFEYFIDERSLKNV